MLNRIRVHLGAIILVIIASCSLNSVQASKNDFKRQDSPTFMVYPHISKNNIGGVQLGYFKVKYQPHKIQTFKVDVYNPTKKVLKISANITDAITLDNGVIDYSHTANSNNSLLKMSGQQFVEYPKQIILKPNTTQTINFKINHYQLKPFKGTKVMAIELTTKDNQYNHTNIKNEYIYQIGLSLIGQKQSLSQLKSKAFNSDQVKVRMIKKKAAISFNIQNHVPFYFKATDISIKMTNQKWQFIKYTSQYNKIKIAPMSFFNSDVLLGGKRLVPGIYQATITIKRKGYRQVIKRYVKISHSQAQYINRNNLHYIRCRNLFVIYSIILISLLTILVIHIKKLKK